MNWKFDLRVLRTILSGLSEEDFTVGSLLSAYKSRFPDVLESATTREAGHRMWKSTIWGAAVEARVRELLLATGRLHFYDKSDGTFDMRGEHSELGTLNYARRNSHMIGCDQSSRLFVFDPSNNDFRQVYEIDALVRFGQARALIEVKSSVFSPKTVLQDISDDCYRPRLEALKNFFGNGHMRYCVFMSIPVLREVMQHEKFVKFDAQGNFAVPMNLDERVRAEFNDVVQQYYY